MSAACPHCKRPVWDGGHALNERECADVDGEVCRLHVRLADVVAERDRLRAERDFYRVAARERERERDENRAALNRIARMFGVVHEDDKIVAAVARCKSDRDAYALAYVDPTLDGRRDT